MVVTRNPGAVVRRHAARPGRRRTTPISPCSSSTAAVEVDPVAAGRRAAAGARSSAGSTRPPASPRRPTRRCTRSRARPSCSSATTTSCSTPAVVRTLVEEAYRSNAGHRRAQARRAPTTRACCSTSGAPSTASARRTPASSPASSTRSSTTACATSSTSRPRRCSCASTSSPQLGGFDPATFPGAEDLDLCWRARLAGARVLVVPDARVAHREAADERAARRPARRRRARAQSRARAAHVVLAAGTLLWLVPFGFVVAFVEAIGDLLTGHPRRARAGDHRWF